MLRWSSEEFVPHERIISKKHTRILVRAKTLLSICCKIYIHFTLSLASESLLMHTEF